MEKNIEVKETIKGRVIKVRDGIEDYRIIDGKLQVRQLTECEKTLAKWGKCIKECVVVKGEIRPQVGPMWNYDERALFVVTVINRTGYFQLHEVVVHLLHLDSLEGKAYVDHEIGSPDVIRLPNIRPGASANTQGPAESWYHSSEISPPRPGFTLVCYGGAFPEYDTIRAKALVSFKAIPYFEERCQDDETIVGT